MSTSPQDFNAKIIEEFHTNEGRVGGVFEGMPLLLLHHTGAKSGQSRINPLAYQADNGRYVIFASKAGAPTNPDWYHNLKANPNVKIEVGADTTGCCRQRGHWGRARQAVRYAKGARAAVRRVRAENGRAGYSGDGAHASTIALMRSTPPYIETKPLRPKGAIPRLPAMRKAQ